eukprot:TRINITY_DN12620_c0_g2_i7.p1 TRINITY_DN12620_c0_g2~~TRINITY_DN12620_c0_g2_i7.p1  ORF type:complete len:137 (+),score=17.44 TRINITY_DN12620_c0_g2_i7:302-712(+)
MNLSHIKCFRFICDAKLFKLPYNLPTGHQFVHLKELSMILNFLDAEMVSLLLFLLRSCPNLQELALEGTCLNEHIPIEIDFWEKQRPPDCFINPLLRVYMHEISLSSQVARSSGSETTPPSEETNPVPPGGLNEWM